MAKRPSVRFRMNNVSDLIDLPELTEDSVLEVLRDRYEKDQIYTRCGDVLLSVNPFKPLEIYDQKHHDKYGLGSIHKDLDPHVFHVAAHAFKRLQESPNNQVVLVSGESGSGKTENTKYMLKHLMQICGDSQGDLHEKILQINPLLEAFGNAKTVLNDNSSRFAKYLQLDFTKDGNIHGATIQDYMLEKSRVVHQGRGEGNFHIFYSFLAGLSDNDRNTFSIRERNPFRIVNVNDKPLTQEDAQQFQKYFEILDGIGITVEEMDNVKAILATILHLTNIEFMEDKSTEMMQVWDEVPLDLVTDLLEVNPETIATALVTKRIKVVGEEIETVRSKKSAEGVRDALAKALYERLFGWIVRKVNESLLPTYESADKSGHIGILDICGFESLQENSFEQMCINLVNEKIQNYMNEQIFKREKQIYETQGVTVAYTDINYKNNDDVISLFLDKGNVLALINEDTKLEQASDKSLVVKLDQKFKTSDIFKKLPGDGLTFRIRHFAGEVTYDARCFLEKNRDALSQEMVKCMQGSTNVMVADLFLVNKGSTGTISVTKYDYRASKRRPSVRRPTNRPVNLTSSIVAGLRKSLTKRFGEVKDGKEKQQQTQTVIEYFHNSLRDLMYRMDKSDSVFVRCIKPNRHLAPSKFDEKFVAKQLKYNGIAEVARIRKRGWPIRRMYPEMLQRFKLLSSTARTVSSREEAAKIIVNAAGLQPSSYTFGKDMIFMKEEAMQKLEGALRRKEEEERRRREEEERRKREEEERRREEEERKKKQEEERRRKIEEERIKRQQVRQTNSGLGLIEEHSSHEGTLNSESSSGSYGSSCRSDQTYANVSDGGRKTPTNTNNRNPAPNASGASPEPPPRRHDESRLEYNFWDVFRVVDTEIPRKEAFNEMTLKVVKVIVYILLFLLLLISCVGQRSGLMLLISNIAANYTETETLKGSRTSIAQPPKLTQYLSLVIVICIPYLLTTIWSFLKWLFGSFPTPGVLTWMTVLLVEALHSLGLSVLVFYVLPMYDLILGCLLLSATSILPSILMITCTSWTLSGDTMGKAVLKKIVDFLAFVCQASVVAVVYLGYSPDFHWKRPQEIWNIPIVVLTFLLSSLKCCENFVDGKSENLSINGEPTSKNYNNAFMNKILKIRYELQEGRYCVSMISGTLKIIVTFAIAYGVMVFQTKDRNIKVANYTILDMFGAFETLYEQPAAFSLLLLVTISGFVAYYTSYIACKLQMQIVSFSIPLLLCLPMTPGVLALGCYYLEDQYSFLKYFSILGKHNTCECEYHFCLSYYWGIPWLLSLLWITRHIWFPRQGRLEDYDRLFMNPFYCGALTQENLLLNRRRHREEVRYDEEVVCSHDKAEEIKEIKEHYFIVNPNKKDNGMPKLKKDDDTSSEIPFIYACATMWHETRIEMTQLMKSLFRLDYDRHIREECVFVLNSDDVRDRFNFQAHIFFDDALELNQEDKWQANSFVKTLISVMNDACSAVHQKYMQIHDPYKVKTPYGVQLIWEMPGGCLLYVHVKDKNKIRHRKRWSQVMYMYYLLGYQLLKDASKDVLNKFNMQDRMNKDGISELFSLDVQEKTKNTYILALDGDTDFSPGSVRVLLDKMANSKTAAVCGRIHPIGSGPLVWYQMFEYAVGHWLQKATEHVLGCVLCSPGCFSLFRASAIMDNNIMRKYTTMPTEPGHFLQYDQGEDRWLCTLLLQQGYRVDYAAAADAYTYAPEGFNEFFNQRRRWTPSTLANILDLLASADVTVARNSNISNLYIYYQIAMMFGTVFGPGTVIMMIAGSIKVVFDIEIQWAYAISLSIPTVYLIVCLTTPTKTQLICSAVFSAIYTFIMMAVIAGTVVTAFTKGPQHPSVVFTCLLFFMFVFAGILHWKEINCLPHCFLYFLCIPSGYLLLFIYSLTNLNNVSWGTREVPKRKSKKELAAEKKAELEKKKNEKKKDGFFARMFFSSTYVKELKQLFESIRPSLLNDKGNQNDEMLALLKQMNQNIASLAGKSNETPTTETETVTTNMVESSSLPQTVTDKTDVQLAGEQDDINSELDDEDEVEELDPYRGKHWAYDPELGNGPVMELCTDENGFWEMFIKKYLKPIDKDEQKEKHIKDGLIELRNSVTFAMVMVNCLWIAVNVMFQINEDVAKIHIYTKPNGEPVEESILGLLFIIFFTVLIVIQFFGMLFHRWETLLHLISMTELTGMKSDQSKQSSEKENIIQKLMGTIEPEPDYEDDQEVLDRIKNVVKEGQTARVLAQSRRQTMIGASRRVGLNNPNLKSTVLGNGLATMRMKSRTRPGYTNNMDSVVDSGEVLRNRFYNPAINHIWAKAQRQGMAGEAYHPEVTYEDAEYAEIRAAMPGKMGRDFARKIRRMKEKRPENGVGRNDGEGRPNSFCVPMHAVEDTRF